MVGTVQFIHKLTEETFTSRDRHLIECCAPCLGVLATTYLSFPGVLLAVEGGEAARLGATTTATTTTTSAAAMDGKEGSQRTWRSRIEVSHIIMMMMMMVLAIPIAE